MPVEHARSQQVVTFVTRAEMAALRELAERSGAPLSVTVYGLLQRCLEELQEAKGEPG